MSAGRKGPGRETAARREQLPARPTEGETLDAFAKALHERFGWEEYPLVLHWCKVLHMTGLRERFLDFAFSAQPPGGKGGTPGKKRRPGTNS